MYSINKKTRFKIEVFAIRNPIIEILVGFGLSIFELLIFEVLLAGRSLNFLLPLESDSNIIPRQSTIIIVKMNQINFSNLYFSWNFIHSYEQVSKIEIAIQYI